MTTSKVMKNGNINLPVEIRKNLDLKTGDRVKFIKTESGYRIVPIRSMADLIDVSEKSKAIEIIEEIQEERRRMAKERR